MTLIRRIVLWLLRKLYKIDCEGRENLKAVRSHLERGSLILCFNHLSADDVIILLAALLPETRGAITQMIIPASRRHWGRPWGLIMRLAPLLGLKALPVVQHYERKKGLYSPQHIFSLDRRFMGAIHETLGVAGGVVLFAPEGHRTETQELQPPQKGIAFLLKWVKRSSFKTKVMLVGVEPPEGYSRGLNLGRRFVIHFGPLLSVREIEEQAQALCLSPGRVIMKKIAQLLPGYSI